MKLLAPLQSLFSILLRRSRVEAEMEEELRLHIQHRADDLERSGLLRAEAERAARIEFGGYERYKEESRESLGVHFFETMVQDARFSLRVLRRSPGFTAVAVLTLALGIGANTTIFTFVSAILLRKPPLQDPDRVMMVSSSNPREVWGADRTPVSAPDFSDWRTQSRSFSGMAAAQFNHCTLSGGTQPERVPAAEVSTDYFSVLGVPPILGRTFASGEDEAGRAHVLMLSEGLWRQRFGDDPDLIGRTLRVNGEAYTVVGIVPSQFQLSSFPAEIWMPLVPTSDQIGSEGRKMRTLAVFARIRPGMNETQAQAEMNTIANRLATTHPETNKGWGISVKSLQEYTIEDANVRPAIVLLMAAVTFVLLIACTNLANLLLARNSARQREFVVRAALGAGRWRLAGQLLSECLILTLAGGSLGSLLAYFGGQLIRSRMNWNAEAVLLGNSIHLDGRVFAFTLAVSVLCAFVCCLAPALQISRAVLKDASRTVVAGGGRYRLQSTLVFGEVALSLILLTGAGLFAKDFVEELQSSLRLNPQNTITATVSLSGSNYKDPANQIAFFENVLRKLSDSPQVESAALTTNLPFTFPGRTRFTLKGHPAATPESRPVAGYYAVSPGYFAVIQTPLLAGREFAASDDSSSASVVIVDAAFAHKYFPNQAPVGRHLRVGSTDLAGAPWSEVVGVVDDVDELRGQSSLATRPHIFTPFLARPDSTMHVVVRTRTDPSSLAAFLRRAVWSVDKEQPVTDVATMTRVIDNSVQGDDLMAGMMSAFATIALAMAAIGIYGLLAYLVGRRTHEIAIRMALGARRSEVLTLIIRRVLSFVLPGVAAGSLVALSLPRVFTATFVGYHVHSAPILAGAPLVVILVAAASCYLPARRAMGVDPVVALRYE
ncbi:MAG TPA: ABC transporter permease [Candidatus Angelobacter sp.]